MGYEGYCREEGSGSENLVERKGRAEAAAGDKGTGHTNLGKLFLKLSRYEKKTKSKETFACLFRKRWETPMGKSPRGASRGAAVVRTVGPGC